MSDDPEVELSVVIPAYNEEATLEDCVRRVYESDCGLVIETVTNSRSPHNAST